MFLAQVYILRQCTVVCLACLKSSLYSPFLLPISFPLPPSAFFFLPLPFIIGATQILDIVQLKLSNHLKFWQCFPLHLPLYCCPLSSWKSAPSYHILWLLIGFCCGAVALIGYRTTLGPTCIIVQTWQMTYWLSIWLIHHLATLSAQQIELWLFDMTINCYNFQLVRVRWH